MDVSSFSISSRGLWSSSSESAEALQPKRIRLQNRYGVCASIVPSKRTERPLLGRRGFRIRKDNRVHQVLCIQKKDVPVLGASCMNEIYDALAERLVPTAAAASNPHFKHIVGLAGPPGAGKSTIASEVVRRVNKLWPRKSYSFDSEVEPPDVATVLPMDGFHLYRHQLDAMEGSVYAPSFDHGVGDPVEDDIYVNLQHKVVIVEGNYLLLEDGLWKEISSMFDEKWFVELDIDNAMQRVLRRHIATAGKPPDIAKWRIDYNDRPNAELINRSRKNADLVIKSVDF